MKTGTPAVSVVMPAKNAEATIGQAIESILAQTFAEFELVLVNHASTDRTREIMQDFQARDSRIVITDCDGSFIDACNFAWQSANGKWIARMDADDFAWPEKLATQLDFLNRNPHLAGCATQVNIVKRSADGSPGPPDAGYAEYRDWINSVVTPEQISLQRFVDSPIPNPTILLSRSILEKYHGYRDEIWAEDYDLWLRLLHDGIEIGKVEKVLLDWYDDDDRTTRTSGRYSLKNFQRAKAAFLAKIPAVRELGVVISGAGPTGKRMARFLRKHGVTIHCFIEVNPAQIGGEAAGCPVLPVSEIPAWQGRAVMLSAVGQSGARERIRDLLEPTRFVEGVDFFCIA